MQANDAVTGAIFTVLAVVIFFVAGTFPDFPGQRYGPALFPQILAVGLGCCGLLLIARGVRARQQGGAWIALDGWARNPVHVISLLLVLALVTIYILISEAIGFLLVAFGLLLILMLWFGVKPLTAVITSAIATYVTHWFFGSMMRVPLPRGILTDYL